MRVRPRRPVVIGQLTYVLPDGNVDPANMTDCGETCAAAVLATSTGLQMAPGCLRQAMGLPTWNGSTTADNIAWALNRLGLEVEKSGAQGRLERQLKVAAGWWGISLGYYAGPIELHWVVQYDHGPARVWYMDPWYREDRSQLWPTFLNQSQGDVVWVRDKNPRRK